MSAVRGPAVFAALLLVLAAWHFLVDAVACVVQPLWPSLESDFQLENGRIFAVYLVWSMTTSFGQFLVGYFADRFPSRWLIWAAPVLAVIAMSLLGTATNVWLLTLLLFLGGLAIAAFHPEAAATAGACFPEHRSRAMSLFALSGYLGQSVGPYYSGLVTQQRGLGGLTAMLFWALPAAAILILATIVVRMWTDASADEAGLPRGKAESEPTATSDRPGSLRESLAPKLPAVGLLILIGMLRVLPALGVPLAVAFLMAAEGQSKPAIGLVQSAFMFGIGGGSFICATCFPRRFERVALWLFPLLSAPLLATIAATSGWARLAVVTLAGSGIGVTLPLLISYGQRLLPEGQRTASSLTMGVTWGLAAGGLSALMSALKHYQHVEYSVVAFAVSVAASGWLVWWLPPAARESGTD